MRIAKRMDLENRCWPRCRRARSVWRGQRRWNGVNADLAARFSVRRARNFIPKQSESYTVSLSAAN